MPCSHVQFAPRYDASGTSRAGGGTHHREGADDLASVVGVPDEGELGGFEVDDEQIDDARAFCRVSWRWASNPRPTLV